jgi:hypothetical protein
VFGKGKVNNNWSWFRGVWIVAGGAALGFAILLVVIMRAPLLERIFNYSGTQLKSERNLPETPHRSDEDLIDNFHANRSEFDRLLGMVMEDKSLYRVDHNWTEPGQPESVGIPQARIDEYRKLMKKLGILRGFSASRARKDVDVEFFSSFEGYAKGYLYAKRPPHDLGANLDDVIQKGLLYGSRHIEGDWYLFYRKDY